MAYVERRKNDVRARWKRPDGTYDSEGGFLTDDEALAYGQDQETDVRRGAYHDKRAGSVLFLDWGMQWLEAIDVLPNSVANYHKRLRAQIFPRWGHMTVAQVAESPMAYRAWEKRIRNSLSRNYAIAVLLVFRMMMDDAVTEGLIPASPVPKENRRRGKYVRPEEPEDIFPTPVQALRLAENARTVWGLPGYVFMLTKAYTGMRQGEMYGLRREYCHPIWPAREPDAQKREKAVARYGSMPALRVEQQHLYVKPDLRSKSIPMLEPPKYGSKRTLVLPSFLAELLCDLLDSHDSEWVFPSMNGGPLLLSDFSSYYWKPIVQGAKERVGRYRRRAILPVEGMAGLVPHGLRHAQKVWCDEDLIPSAASEERMGHLLQGVEGVYSHVTVPMEALIARKLQERWQQSLQEAGRGAPPGEVRR
jgi:integrase